MASESYTVKAEADAGSDGPQQRITRRTFLGGTAAVGALAGLSGVFGPSVFQGVASAFAASNATDNTPKHLFTSCHQCDQQCAAIATVRGGIVTKLDGNPDDIKSAGHLCPKGQAGIMEAYNPYRLKKPLLRTNPEKGLDVDPGWKEVEWDEAISTIADKLSSILESDGPRAVAADDNNIVGNFCNAIGTPNTYRCAITCYYAAYGTQTILLGGNFCNADLRPEVTRYVLMLSNTVGTVENPFGRQVAEVKATGAKVAVLDPRYSEAAAKADVWAPIKPGTDLAACLAFINVLITEDLYDHDYVDAKTTGIEELTSFIEPYTPEWAAPLCGVDAAVLRQIGEDLGNRRPSVVTLRRGAAKQRKGYWKVVHAWVILNALIGAIDMPGGTIADRAATLGKLSPAQKLPAKYPQSVDSREKLFPTPGGVYDSAMATGGLQTTLSDSLINGAYPIKFLICAGANWLHSSPNTEQWAKALDGKFLTVLDYQMTDTGWMADAVLPCSTYLERDEVISAGNYAPVPQVQARQAVIDPLYDSKSDDEIFGMLAEALDLQDYMPPSGPDALDTTLAPLNTTFDDLKKEGLLHPDQPFKPASTFKTPSGKIELYSSLLADAGFDPLPTWDGAAMTPTADYPFYFISFNVARGYMSEHAWNAWLVEPDDTGVWINSQTAADKGINDGDNVKVTSAYGSLTAPAKVTGLIRPDTVGMLHGRGYRNPFTSPTARDGANENDIARPSTAQDLIDAYQAKEEPVGLPEFRDIVVSIEKA